MIHSSQGQSSNLYDDSILSASSGGSFGYFESKVHEIKVTTDMESQYVLKIWDCNSILDDKSVPLFETNAFGPGIWHYVFSQRGFYAIELINVSEGTEYFVLSYFCHKGLQMDFQIQLLLVMAMGIILFISGTYLGAKNERHN